MRARHNETVAFGQRLVHREAQVALDSDCDDQMLLHRLKVDNNRIVNFDLKRVRLHARAKEVSVLNARLNN